MIVNRPKTPTRAVPQGGVPPTFLDPAHQRSDSTGEGKIAGEGGSPVGERRLLMQPFADDISAAVIHEVRGKTIAPAGSLAGVLLAVPWKLDLDVAILKCRNFLEGGGHRADKFQNSEELGKIK